MSLILMMSLQAMAAANPPAPAAPPAPAPAAVRWLDFDLARYRSSGSGTCLGAPASDVLVCGRHGRGAYPIDYWDRIFGPERPIRAEMNLGGGVQGRVYTDAVPMDRGAVSERVLVGIKLPF